MRLRRSELSTPGSSEKMIEKAASSSADLVFLDLEDSVAPSEKADARRKIVDAFNSLDWGNKTRAVRINGAHTQFAHEDIIELVTGAGENLDLLIVPKVKGVRDVWWVDTLLSQLEEKIGRSTSVALEVLIEEVEALIEVEAIATATPRLEAIIFGPGDLAGSQGVRLGGMIGEGEGYPGDIWHYARAKIIVAARAAGIEAVDGPYANFRNSDGYRREAGRSAMMGYSGKWAIHPSQIEIANEVYSPTDKEIEMARGMVSAYEKAEGEGAGAVGVDGAMIDAATIRIMQNVLTKADLIEKSK